MWISWTLVHLNLVKFTFPSCYYTAPASAKSFAAKFVTGNSSGTSDFLDLNMLQLAARHSSSTHGASLSMHCVFSCSCTYLGHSFSVMEVQTQSFSFACKFCCCLIHLVPAHKISPKTEIFLGEATSNNYIWFPYHKPFVYMALLKTSCLRTWYT